MTDLFSNDAFRFLLLINMIAALGMHIVYATGQLNLGQAGFLAVGAYTTAVLEKTLGLPLLFTLPAAAVAASIVALPIAFGANRVRGVYLIMGTLAVGEVVQVTIGNIDALGGLQGYAGIQPVTLKAATTVFLFILVGTRLLVSTPLGLQMRAIFDDEDAAAVSGVATRRVKITAVVLSAAVVGVAGGLMAKWLLFIAPHNFGIDVSFRIALFTLLGGVHTMLGSLFGALIVTTLLEALRLLGGVDSLPNWIQAMSPWRQVIYGCLVMILMAVRPEGMFNRQWALYLTQPLRQTWRKWVPPVFDNGASTAKHNKIYTRDHTHQDRALLRLEKISHSFGGLLALNKVSFTVNKGEILGLIGANGAGKTTLINVISGFYALQNGRISLDDHDLTHMRPDQRTKAGVARTFQSGRTFAHLTVGEHLRLGQLGGGEKKDISPQQIAARLGLSQRLDTLPQSLPLGIQRQLEIGRAIAGNPEVVFLDEPSVGMNEEERQELAALIADIREWGITVVLVDHNLDLVFQVADRTAVLDFGSLLTIDKPSEVLQDRRVRAAYLGEMEIKV